MNARDILTLMIFQRPDKHHTLEDLLHIGKGVLPPESHEAFLADAKQVIRQEEEIRQELLNQLRSRFKEATDFKNRKVWISIQRLTRKGHVISKIRRTLTFKRLRWDDAIVHPHGWVQRSAKPRRTFAHITACGTPDNAGITVLGDTENRQAKWIIHQYLSSTDMIAYCMLVDKESGETDIFFSKNIITK